MDKNIKDNLNNLNTTVIPLCSMSSSLLTTSSMSTSLALVKLFNTNGNRTMSRTTSRETRTIVVCVLVYQTYISTLYVCRVHKFVGIR